MKKILPWKLLNRENFFTMEILNRAIQSLSILKIEYRENISTVKNSLPWQSILIYTGNWVPRKNLQRKMFNREKLFKILSRENPWKYSDRQKYKPWKVHDHEKSSAVKNSLPWRNSILKNDLPWKCSYVKNFRPWKSILNYGTYPRFWTVKNSSPWKWSEVKMFYRENIQTWKIN